MVDDLCLPDTFDTHLGERASGQVLMSNSGSCAAALDKEYISTYFCLLVSGVPQVLNNIIVSANRLVARI